MGSGKGGNSAPMGPDGTETIMGLWKRAELSRCCKEVDVRMPSTYWPPKSCIPKRANTTMKRKRRNNKLMMDFMEFRRDTTRFLREAQYLPTEDTVTDGYSQARPLRKEDDGRMPRIPTPRAQLKTSVAIQTPLPLLTPMSGHDWFLASVWREAKGAGPPSFPPISHLGCQGSREQRGLTL